MSTYLLVVQSAVRQKKVKKSTLITAKSALPLGRALLIRSSDSLN